MAERSETTATATAIAGGGTHELLITRVLEAPRALAFEVWTTPEHLARWWGPRDEAGRDFAMTSCEMDFRPGGRYRIGIRSPQGEEMHMSGRYREIVVPERIVFSFAWEGAEDRWRPETLVDVRFEAQGAARTLMSFRQIGLPTAEDRDSHRTGWTHCIDRLAEHLAARSGAAS